MRFDVLLLSVDRILILFFVRCSLFIVRCSLFVVVRCALLFVVVCCRVFVVCWSLRIPIYLLLSFSFFGVCVDCCLVIVAVCGLLLLLFAVRCFRWLVVFCYC